MLPEPLDPASVLPWEAGFVAETTEAPLPGLSIVLPVFNAGKFLEKTIRSLLCNDLSGVELIMMDGGSTDNTAEILDHYRDHFAVCVSEKDEGQSDAINKGFARARHELLYWLNGDDLLLPNTLNTVRRRFGQADKPQVVVGDAYMTELDLTPIRHFQFSDEKLKFSYLLDYAAHHLVQPSVFFTRKAWDACGPVNNELHYAMDADLFLHMSAHFNMVHLPLDIAYSVYHEECKTRGKRAESITELGLVQARHGGFEHAERTLNILVDMFNTSAEQEIAGEGHNGVSEEHCATCKVTKDRMKLLEAELEEKKRMQLALDMGVS